MDPQENYYPWTADDESWWQAQDSDERYQRELNEPINNEGDDL